MFFVRPPRKRARRGDVQEDEELKTALRASIASMPPRQQTSAWNRPRARRALHRGDAEPCGDSADEEEASMGNPMRTAHM